MFTISGPGFDGSDFTFNDLELVPDKAEYAPGDVMRLQVNANRSGATVLLFVRPEIGVYPPPRMVHLDGKSTVVEVEVTESDMPNLLIEAESISGARVHTVSKDIAVPPVEKVINVEIAAGPKAYKPGQDATIKLRLSDAEGNPVVGDLALSVYDKSVEYISGGPNSEDIRKAFWDWRRSHYPRRNDSLALTGYNLVPRKTIGMQPLGLFGHLLPNEQGGIELLMSTRTAMPMPMAMAGEPMEAAPIADAAPQERVDALSKVEEPKLLAPAVRKEFADTALWRGALESNADGIAEVSFKMPENLTTWKIMTWAVSHGARVGSGEAEVVTRKNLLVRLQTPRFLVERDEVVLSANVHNYLEQAKLVTVRLELDGSTLEAPTQLTQEIEVPAGGDRRVDWRVNAVAEGKAVVRALALTDEESDAMQLEFPVRVHGFLKQDAYSGVVAANQNSGTFEINVPSERRVEQTRLEVRYSPTLAGAMIDALPYLIDYPHGCTEQTLNRFLPAVITQQTLRRMGVNLAAVQGNQTNLNPQELGAPAERRAGWQRGERDPVFDEAELDKIVKAGVRRLQDMQLSDGGWGWFSG
ncbi:MAG: alpha-2-macroglobulin, partial [Planctomycetales bacterium]|nr:alpha-2-macroglobulin [Planctomycetales bacterium]